MKSLAISELAFCVPQGSPPPWRSYLQTKFTPCMYSLPTIRVATKEDEEGLWNILEPMIRKGGAYVFLLDKSKKSLMDYWLGTEKTTFAVERGGELVGTFYLKANQEGLGDHVCNAGFVVAQEAEGQGLGRWMGTIALEEAKNRGYLAMQFNFVIQTNEPAVHLWKSLGFSVLGEIPEAYRHPKLGLVSALIFYKKL